jgi:rubrerythrin
MIKIDPKFVEQVKRATSYEDLFPLMQNAIELEHATIPPYLTAIFSLKPKTNNEIRKLIHSIVIEEMLHMTISSNILNALGGAPAINNKSFVPRYPTKLPMGIGEDLVVGLANYSIDQVVNVFMRIEEPEHPIPFESLAAEALTFSTIGEFYAAIQAKIIELPGEKLPGDKKRQVTSSFFPDDLLYPIHTTAEAVSAINIIVRQGEGTTTTPFDEEGHLAHYYEFEELYKGRRLVKDPSAPNGYSFSGDVIPFDQDDVFPLFPNTKAAMLAAGSEERRRADDFNVGYSRLLNGLHKTFNGCPDFLDGTIGLMYDVKLSGEKLCATPFPGVTGMNIGPPFEFVDVND